MTASEAKKILVDYQKWRRAESPYDGETPETFRTYDWDGMAKLLGEAIDKGIEVLSFVEHWYGDKQDPTARV